MQRLVITKHDFSKEDLEKLYKKEKNSRLKERILAIILVMEGNNCIEISNILKKDRNTIENWVKTYNTNGLNGLKPKKSPGRPHSLTLEQLNSLKEDIKKNPREIGYEFSNWNGRNVAMHIEKKFGVKLKTRRAIYILHDLGLTLQRPKHKYIKADPEAQAIFQENLKKRLRIWA